MKRILISSILVFLFVSCKKREYIPDNSFCIYKNYLMPDTIPFDITGLAQPVHNSLLRTNKVLHLNAFNFIEDKNIRIYKIQDSLYRFLHKKYLECCAENRLNTDIITDSDRKYMFEIPQKGCYYFCGNLSVTPKVQSLVFLTTNYEKSFRYNDLILFNVKDNKLLSVIRLSKYIDEDKEEDLELKTFLVDNKEFVSIESPFDDYQEIGQFGLTNKNDTFKIERLYIFKERSPFNYCTFRIGSDGYIRLTPTMFTLKNIDKINKEGQIPHRRGVM